MNKKLIISGSSIFEIPSGDGEKRKGLVPVSDEVMKRLNAPKKVKEKRAKEFMDKITGKKEIELLKAQKEDVINFVREKDKEIKELNKIKEDWLNTFEDLKDDYVKVKKQLQQKNKELEKIIVDFKNPYPKDIFRWNNKEKLNFDRGRFNEFTHTIVENMRKELLKQLKETTTGG